MQSFSLWLYAPHKKVPARIFDNVRCPILHIKTNEPKSLDFGRPLARLPARPSAQPSVIFVLINFFVLLSF